MSAGIVLLFRFSVVPVIVSSAVNASKVLKLILCHIVQYFNIFVVWCSLPRWASKMDEHVLRGSCIVAKQGGWEYEPAVVHYFVGGPQWKSQSVEFLNTVPTSVHMATNSKECTFFKNEEFMHDNLLQS
jgi:hypothetical protein